MSQGKYSPACPHSNDNSEFIFNCFKQEPVPWNAELSAAGVVYDEKTMYPNYDSEGFDRYGYSAFDSVGNYVGIGSGIDRLGYTACEYMCMPEDKFYDMPTTPIVKNTTLYVVHGTTGGYAREDAPNSSVAGVYSDPVIAEKVRKAVGYGATVTSIELNKVQPGYVSFLEAMGFDTSDLNP